MDKQQEEAGAEMAQHEAERAERKTNHTHAPRRASPPHTEGELPHTSPSVVLGARVSLSAQKRISLGHHGDGGMVEAAGPLTLRARTGVLLDDGLVPRFSGGKADIVVDADYDENGDGALQLAVGAPLSSAGSLTITAADIELRAPLSALGGTLLLQGAKPRQTLGLGTVARRAASALSNERADLPSGADMQLGGAALRNVRAPHGMVFGGEASGHIEVGSVPAQDAAGIGGILTLLAAQVGSQVSFDAQPATFSALAVQAYSGVTVHGNTSTVKGSLLLEGNLKNSTTEAELILGAGVLLDSAGKLTLGSHAKGPGAELRGGITLRAQAGVNLHPKTRMTGPKRHAAIHIHSDTDKDGVGILTVQGGLSTNSNTLTVTASDLDLQGLVSAGEASITVQPSKLKATIAVGGSATNRPKFTQQLKTANYFVMSSKDVDMHVDQEELQQMTASETVMGGASNGNIFVDEIQENRTKAAGAIRLVATSRDSIVNIMKQTSFEHGLTVQAEGGIIVNKNLTTRGAETRLHSGTGALIIKNAATVNTSGEELFVVGDQLDLRGEIHTGLGAASIYCHTDGNTVGIGRGSGRLQLSGAELQRLHVTGLSMGGDVCGNMIVNTVQASESANIDGILTLAASREDTHIIIGDAPSSFNALVAQADNGVFVSGDLTTTSNEFGIMTLDGDMHEDERNNGTYRPTSYTSEMKHRALVFADALTVSASMTLSLGGVWEEKRIQWRQRQALQTGVDKTENVTEKVEVVTKVQVPLTVQGTQGDGDSPGGTSPTEERQMAMRREMDYYGPGGQEEEVDETPPPTSKPTKRPQDYDEAPEGPEASVVVQQPSPPLRKPDTAVDITPAGGSTKGQRHVAENAADTPKQEGSRADVDAADTPKQEGTEAVQDGQKASEAVQDGDAQESSSQYSSPENTGIDLDSLSGECKMPRIYNPRVYVPRPMCDLDGSAWWW